MDQVDLQTLLDVEEWDCHGFWSSYNNFLVEKGYTLYKQIEDPIDGIDLVIGNYQPVAVPLAPYEPVLSEAHIYAFFSRQVPATVFSHIPKVRSQLIILF
jgi:hypothetical protein